MEAANNNFISDLNKTFLEHAYPEEVHRQLLLLSQEELSKKLGFHTIDWKNISAVPLEVAVKLLPIARKISVLFSSIGIAKTIEKLHLTDKDQKEAEQFFQEVTQLSDGVITVYSLDSLRMLHMFVFAEVERCSNRKLTTEERTQLQVQSNKLELIFTVLENCLDTPTELSNCKGAISIAIQFFDGLDVKPTRLLSLLQLVEKSINNPLVFFPQLLRSIRIRPLKITLGQDLSHADSKVKFWLDDFLTALKQQSQSFFEEFKPLKIHAAPFQTIVSEGKRLIDSSIPCLNKLHEYQQLSARKRWEKRQMIADLKSEYAKWQSSYKDWMTQYEKWTEQIKPSIKNGLKYNTKIYYPFSNFQDLLYYLNLSISHGCDDEEFFNTEIESILDPSIKKMAFISLVDLLQFQSKSLFWKNWKQLKNRDISLDRLTQLNSSLDIIWIEIRRYYTCRKHLDKRQLQDFHQNMNLVTIAGMIIEEASTLEKLTENREILNFLNVHKQLGSLLLSTLYKERWPRLFLESPFADPAFTNEHEESFYFELFSLLHLNFFELNLQTDFIDDCRKELQDLPAEDPCQKLIEKNLVLLSKALRKLENHRQPPTLDNFKKEARYFFDLLGRLHEQILANNEDSDPVREDLLLKIALPEFLLERFFSPGQPLVTYLNREECLEEERIRKIKKVEKPTIESPQIAPKVTKVKQTVPPVTYEAPQEVIVLSPIDELEQLCSSLSPICQNFIAKDESGKGNSYHLHEHLTNLQELIPSLRELKQKGSLNRPFTIASAYLKVALLLEQSTKLAASIRSSSFDNQTHTPHLIAELLEKEGLTFTPEEKALFKKMERVVSVSSRYPASGRDALTKDLKEGRDAQKLLEAGIETCNKILKWAVPDSTRVEVLKTLPTYSLEPLSDLSETVEDHLESLLKSIQRIQRTRMFPGQQEVPPLNTSSPQRIRTIDIGLQDLKINLKILSDLFHNPDASLCHNVAEEVCLRQAVILERLLLISLAHLPCSSDSDPNQHYLFEENGMRLKRDSHQIEEFVEKLSESLSTAKITREKSLFDQTKEQAEALSPILKHLYRYNGSSDSPYKAILDEFKALSQLRNRLQMDPNCLSAVDEKAFDKILEVTHASERLAKLDAYILKALQSKVYQPCQEFLPLAKEFLKIYEELLK